MGKAGSAFPEVRETPSPVTPASNAARRIRGSKIMEHWGGKAVSGPTFTAGAQERTGSPPPTSADFAGFLSPAGDDCVLVLCAGNNLAVYASSKKSSSKRLNSTVRLVLTPIPCSIIRAARLSPSRRTTRWERRCTKSRA